MVRTKKELGQLLLDNQNLFGTGLCSWVSKLYNDGLITVLEYRLLNNIIKSNKPIYYTLLNDIYNPDRKLYIRPYYWQEGYIKPRIKWIKKHLMK